MTYILKGLLWLVSRDGESGDQPAGSAVFEARERNGSDHGAGTTDPQKGQIAKPFNSPLPKVIFKLRVNQGDFKVISRFPAKTIWNLFLGPLVYRFEFCSFYPHAGFELFICYLNRFKLSSGKQLSLGGGSFAYLIIRYASPVHCLSGNSIFCETSDGW